VNAPDRPLSELGSGPILEKHLWLSLNPGNCDRRPAAWVRDLAQRWRYVYRNISSNAIDADYSVQNAIDGPWRQVSPLVTPQSFPRRRNPVIKTLIQ
jgi:hypothetical protein